MRAHLIVLTFVLACRPLHAKMMVLHFFPLTCQNPPILTSPPPPPPPPAKWRMPCPEQTQSSMLNPTPVSQLQPPLPLYVKWKTSNQEQNQSSIPNRIPIFHPPPPPPPLLHIYRRMAYRERNQLSMPNRTLKSLRQMIISCTQRCLTE